MRAFYEADDFLTGLKAHEASVKLREAPDKLEEEDEFPDFVTAGDPPDTVQ